MDSRTRYLKLAYLELDGHKVHSALALMPNTVPQSEKFFIFPVFEILFEVR